MLHHRDRSGRKVDTRWHEFRQQAREHSFSKEEFAESSQIRYDLDTAGIDGGKYNTLTYLITRPIPANLELKNGVDVRTLDDR